MLENGSGRTTANTFQVTELLVGEIIKESAQGLQSEKYGLNKGDIFEVFLSYNNGGNERIVGKIPQMKQYEFQFDAVLLNQSAKQISPNEYDKIFEAKFMW